MNDLFRPASAPDAEGYELRLAPDDAGWTYCGLRVLRIEPGGSRIVHTGDAETLVLPLEGALRVMTGDDEFDLTGRPDVFSGVTDFCYLPVGVSATLSSRAGALVALPSARTDQMLPAKYVAAGEVPVEIRGAGLSTRQVHNFGVPGVLAAGALIACEVITPAGNTSSYPPHKHDQERDGESVLEEIYYYRTSAPAGIALQRVYSTDPDRPLDLTTEVRTGDTVLIPHGWHGPTVALPGYHLYYLNVMAGPGERAWLITDDPDHAWVRETWSEQQPDPRLPLGLHGRGPRHPEVQP